MKHIKQLVEISKETQALRNEIQSETKGIRDGLANFEDNDVDFYKGYLQALEYVIELINKL
jgi:hypothetical protein